MAVATGGQAGPANDHGHLTVHRHRSTLAAFFVRDYIEVRLNTKAVQVRAEGGRQVVDQVSDDCKRTAAVDAILTSTGRMPKRRGSG